MTRYHQPRIGPDRRVQDRRRKPAPAEGAGPPPSPARAILRRWRIPLAVALVAGSLGGMALVRWSRPAAGGSPLDRTEAVCRLLARSSRDTLPGGFQSGVELRHGRFGPHTAPAVALQHALGLDEARVLKRWTQRVGDYDVAAMWVRLPENDRHALVIGWIEGSDLAICRFRFPASGPRLNADEVERGDDLLDRILVPQIFGSGG